MDRALPGLLRAIGVPAVWHRFRLAFRMWFHERTNAPHAVMEPALAPTVGSAAERAPADDVPSGLEKRKHLWDLACDDPEMLELAPGLLSHYDP
ncbi:MAG: hypothetical protein OXF33_00705 [Rhodospirillales bacterium]|nr:hypothetical protein [Rhodospirillales bacterium]MCY4002221.1 hypothetical protein [Rhodospirillales bacterium]MCY4098784.1 hypothetical protein [Rhodospirillales bacterium]